MLLVMDKNSVGMIKCCGKVTGKFSESSALTVSSLITKVYCWT